MKMKNTYYLIPSLAALMLLGTACQNQPEAASAAKAPAAVAAKCTMKLSAQDSVRKSANSAQQAIMNKKLTPEQAKAMRAFDDRINQTNRSLVWNRKYDEADMELKKLLAEKDQEQALRSKILVFLADNLWRRGDLPRAERETNELLNKYADVITPADKAALLRYIANAQDRQKKYCEKAQTLYNRLGCGITETDAESTCRELITAVWTAGKKAEAIALSKEFVGMFDDKTESARAALLLSYARSMKDEALCREALALYKDAEKDINKVANETIMIAAVFRGKEQSAADCLAIVTNPACAFRLRVNALAEYINSPAAKKNSTVIVDLANKHLFTVKDIPPADYGHLVFGVLLNHVVKTMGRNDLAEQYCKSLLAYPQIANHQKVDALKRLSTYMATRGDYADAFNLVEQGFTYDKLAYTHYVELCKQIANLLKWQGKCDEAVKYLRSKITEPTRQLLLKEIAAVYIYFRELDKAYATYQEAGLPVDAIRVYSGIDPAKSAALALKIIEDENNYKEQERGALLSHFLGSGKRNADIRKKYAHLMKYVDSGTLNGVIRYAATAKDYDRVFELIGYQKENNRFVLDNVNVQFLTEYYINTGNVQKLRELKEQLAGSRADAKTKQKYGIVIDCFTAVTQDKAGAFNAFYKDYKFPAGMNQKDKADLLLTLSSGALNAKMFTVSEEIYKTYLSLYKPEPCKTYTVPFSDEPVLGVHGFMSLKKMPEAQFMDRKYGGNMDFLVTDVSTGDRGAAIAGKKSTDVYKASELRMICDKYGLHMMFKAFDSKAKEIEAGIASAGSFEMYFAPGDNQPYYCPLPDMGNTAVGIWNSSYNNSQWRQLDPNGKTNFDIKTEKVFTDDGYIVYMFIAWDKFYDKLPEKGDTWDFENIHWSRFGGNSWNGLKTIHGRSTWGKLVFDISDDQMRQIKRNLIIKARKAYLKEKSTSGRYHGEIDRWRHDRFVGDTAFYYEKVAPLVQKLDSYLPLVTADMDDATVDKIFFEAVPGWNEIRYKIADLRREYLEEQLTK